MNVALVTDALNVRLPQVRRLRPTLEDAGSWGEYIARSGESYSPRIPNVEPLLVECEHFIECIRTGATPRSDGRSGVRVVGVLERLQKTLES
jgi:predicted dehydrogenase